VADAGLIDGANPAFPIDIPARQKRNTMTQTASVVEIGAEDIPLHCPTGNTPAWNYHPRVFLDVADTGEVKCPYCGTVYKLKPGTVLKGHH
jgi:uncharacterized Zn-finger protein